jgi:phenylacetate-CoA ligase
MEVRYRHPELETMPRERLEALQLTRLRETLGWALRTPFYRERLGGIGLRDPRDIASFADLSRIPFTTKDDLRSAYPYGMLSIPKEDAVRLHASSGTTGIPTVIYQGARDMDAWTELVARSLVAVGCTKSDVFQNMMTYGLFTGGLGLHYGAERLGMLVIPISGGNTKRQFNMMRDFGSTVVHATPSYMLHLRSKFEEEGIDRGALAIKKALVGAEPHSEDCRRKIEESWGIDAYNSYGLSEMNGPGVAFECVCKEHMHVWEDAFILECVDRHSLEPVPDGEVGELVMTTLTREATPILRYRTRDLSRVYPATCPCGRSSRRIGRILGRTDDMLIINGVNVFPSQIEEAIMRMGEVGNNYQIVVEKEGALDRLIVKTEVGDTSLIDDPRKLEALKRKIGESLKASISIHPRIELHEPGFLPVYEGKAKRVFDRRDSSCGE